MNKKNPIEFKILENRQQYSSDFIKALRDLELLKDIISDEKAFGFVENADYMVVALKNNILVGGFLLFCRSPHEVFWTDLYCLPDLKRDRFIILSGLMNKLGDIMVDNNICWVLGIPTDKRVIKFYHLLGFLSLNKKVLGIPMGISHPIYKKTKDNFFFRFLNLNWLSTKTVLENNILQLSGTSTKIRIDLKSGSTQYSLRKQPEKWYVYDKLCSKQSFLCINDYSQHKIHGSIADMIFLPDLGRIDLPEIGLTLRSPWWTKVPSTGIRISVHDCDPCKMTKEKNGVHIFKWNAYPASKIKPHRMTVDCTNNESCIFTYTSLSEFESLRLYFDFNQEEKPEIHDNFFIYSKIKFCFNTNYSGIKKLKKTITPGCRIFFYFTKKEVKVTLKRIKE